MAVASLVLGILALIGFALPIPFFVEIISILAIIFGALGAKKPQGKGMAIAGLVLGIIALVIRLVIWIFAVAIISSFF